MQNDKKERSHKGKPQPKYNAEEKRIKVQAICDMYAKGEYTVAACAEYHNITERTFFEWIKDSELSAIYEDAKNRMNFEYMARLRVKSKSVIESYLESEQVDKTEQVFITKEIIVENGQRKTVKALKEEKKITYIRKPSEKMAMWVAEKLIPEFAPKQEITHNIGKGVIIIPAEKEMPQEQPISLDELLENIE